MMTMRTALPSDITKIKKLIKQMNANDLKYLQYQEETDPLIPRLIKNTNENHVVLFLEENTVIGFLEYELIDNQTKLWVCSLYLKPKYRQQGMTRILIEAYKKVSNEHKLPLAYRIHDSNTPMWRLTRYIKGSMSQKDKEGYIIVNVSMEDLIQ